MNITELNRECLLHVFSFLDKESRRNASLTCRRLRFLFHDAALWPLLVFHSPSELRRDNFVLGAALRHLSICWHSSRVKVCNIEDWMKSSFQRDLCRKHENIVGNFLWKVSSKCPSLRSLSLAGCGHVTDQHICEILQSCPRLKSLQLENCVRITDRTLHAVTTYGTSLASLRVDFCRNVSQAGLQLVRTTCPGLEVLAERSGGMIPDSQPDEREKLGRTLQKLLLYS
ncbi:F-box and leucine-rich protein 22 [Erpetoichthys calabaricus]|uniref:F-box and leucine-rich repeat protein 22 n=1 Tax=Erpetoichthys calabaricus TaxID=27687 RepID=A0A8C4TEF2_ERPCA|nr:F-box and leucine-rich protein 22 [Erpetoichthys calabaricus]